MTQTLSFSFTPQPLNLLPPLRVLRSHPDIYCCSHAAQVQAVSDTFKEMSQAFLWVPF